MRNISDQLLNHLSQNVTTTCKILSFALKDGRKFGMTSLDVDIEYDGLMYRSTSGIESSIIATDRGLSVDNGEARTLLINYEDIGFNEEMLMAGDLDDAIWNMKLINFMDTSMGHIILDSGDIGNVKIEYGLIASIELVSFAMRLRQPIGTLDSRTCRAIFGTPSKGQLGCGIDESTMWVSGTVTALNDEPFRVFQDINFDISTVQTPARIRWLTGKNSTYNRLYQLESIDLTGKAFAMFETTPYKIEVGDTFEIRNDCLKTKDACKLYGNLLNFKGEPYIPVGDGIT